MMQRLIISFAICATLICKSHARPQQPGLAQPNPLSIPAGPVAERPVYILRPNGELVDLHSTIRLPNFNPASPIYMMRPNGQLINLPTDMSNQARPTYLLRPNGHLISLPMSMQLLPNLLSNRPIYLLRPNGQLVNLPPLPDGLPPGILPPQLWPFLPSLASLQARDNRPTNASTSPSSVTPSASVTPAVSVFNPIIVSIDEPTNGATVSRPSTASPVLASSSSNSSISMSLITTTAPGPSNLPNQSATSTETTVADKVSDSNASTTTPFSITTPGQTGALLSTPAPTLTPPALVRTNLPDKTLVSVAPAFETSTSEPITETPVASKPTSVPATLSDHPAETVTNSVPAASATNTSPPQEESTSAIVSTTASLTGETTTEAIALPNTAPPVAADSTEIPEVESSTSSASDVLTTNSTVPVAAPIIPATAAPDVPAITATTGPATTAPADMAVGNTTAPPDVTSIAPPEDANQPATESTLAVSSDSLPDSPTAAPTVPDDGTATTVAVSEPSETDAHDDTTQPPSPPSTQDLLSSLLNMPWPRPIYSLPESAPVPVPVPQFKPPPPSYYAPAAPSYHVPSAPTNYGVPVPPNYYSRGSPYYGSPASSYFAPLMSSYGAPVASSHTRSRPTVNIRPNGDYNYYYSVNNPATGDTKSQSERRLKGKVVGQYALVQPDGYLRKVSYTADAENGFRPIITYDPLGPMAIGRSKRQYYGNVRDDPYDGDRDLIGDNASFDADYVWNRNVRSNNGDAYFDS